MSFSSKLQNASLALTFDDVLIAPRFSKINSSAEVDLSVSYQEHTQNLPIISANMDTVTGTDMAIAMLNNGAQACLHRFQSLDELLEQFNQVQQVTGKLPFVSIGVTDQADLKFVKLYDAGADKFIIDVAHGAQRQVVDSYINMLAYIGVQMSKGRELCLTSNHGNAVIKPCGMPYIVVGNFATVESVKAFCELLEKKNIALPSAIKVGVGPGSVCTTRIKTGCGVPQLSAIAEIADYCSQYNIDVIADGGMREPGDIAKALAAGAKMVMLGGMLAGTDETPGEIIEEIIPGHFGPISTGKKFKKYRGSASKESYEAQGKIETHRTAEGETTLVPYKGPLKDVLQDIAGGLRRALAYVGARNLTEFRERAKFVRVTQAGRAESLPHGKK